MLFNALVQVAKVAPTRIRTTMAPLWGEVAHPWGETVHPGGGTVHPGVTIMAGGFVKIGALDATWTLQKWFAKYSWEDESIGAIMIFAVRIVMRTTHALTQSFSHPQRHRMYVWIGSRLALSSH